MRYRRDYTNGATYFFTVTMLRRLPWFAHAAAVDALLERALGEV